MQPESLYQTPRAEIRSDAGRLGFKIYGVIVGAAMTWIGILGSSSLLVSLVSADYRVMGPLLIPLALGACAMGGRIAARIGSPRHAAHAASAGAVSALPSLYLLFRAAPELGPRVAAAIACVLLAAIMMGASLVGGWVASRQARSRLS